MLASRQLPPPVYRPPLPLPVATFYNIPRRYVKSNMQVSDDIAPEDDQKLPRTLRKSSRNNDSRAASTSGPIRRTKEEVKIPASNPQSPGISKRRATFLDNDGNDIRLTDSMSPDDSRPFPSASSTTSGELSGHVCLCQPEPKIPRPRNAFILYRQHHQHAIVARNPGLTNPEISKIIGEQWNSESENQKKTWQDLAQEEKVRHQEQYPDYRYQPRRLGKAGSISSPLPNQLPTVDKYRCPRCGGRSIKTPTSPFIASPVTSLPPPDASENLTPTTRYLPMMTSSLSLESPAHRRRGFGPSGLSSIQVPTSAPGDQIMYSPLTPDSKRRRYNYPNPSNGRRSEGQYYQTRHGSLPPINQMRPSPPNTATMPPPPRTPRDPRRASMDLNLLVPNHHDQSRSVEAMVMSVPYQIKVKVLGRITPPLKQPGPTSPAPQVRGAIIAIEGDCAASIEELATWLQDYLEKENEYRPRVVEPPKVPEDDSGEVTFEEYLDLIKTWHGRSREMIEYISTPVAVVKDDEAQSTSSSSEAAILPVVILPTYQLHASNVYTSRIPIQDAYSPTDHWQWMATLWRGTVGPDLTIYVHSGENKEGTPTGAKTVELNEDVRLLTVRKDKDKEIDSSALRRVGFEVGEWIRTVGTNVG
ncbi:hypothetical protein BU24DRAFT_149715 [Aaosphaeria arxii CBS 175.79]|uniref:HMG box domain-containing protein n=1 Tax=Aaosphaeria arxii CBS 175.79 TaxID=1450172 RepID=A0A6A5XYP1_9PLEO|nr:uncharacterized protein BU24DRAFT_149715 [Aaosphaeria arxii CBS 175.79]KAF2017394.1 hypothetical protein BU24DRAFT_149715 [Aaosphaeria arxii CBS 175.79]